MGPLAFFYQILYNTTSVFLSPHTCGRARARMIRAGGRACKEGGEAMRRRTVMLSSLLALIFGFLLGTIFPPDFLPWSVNSRQQPGIPAQPAALFGNSTNTSASTVPAEQSGAEQEQLNTKDNFPLLNTACFVVRAIQQRDYVALSAYVDPEQGLTFTTFSTVDREIDLNFTPDEVAAFDQNTTNYSWAVLPGSGDILTMTPDAYFSSYIFNVDYTQTTLIGIDRVNLSGNALENVAEAYPGCRFVDFTYPGPGAGSAGQEWSSLKLVFAPAQTRWLLVGLIHSQWTV